MGAGHLTQDMGHNAFLDDFLCGSSWISMVSLLADGVAKNMILLLYLSQSGDFEIGFGSKM